MNENDVRPCIRYTRRAAAFALLCFKLITSRAQTKLVKRQINSSKLVNYVRRKFLLKNVAAGRGLE